MTSVLFDAWRGLRIGRGSLLLAFGIFAVAVAAGTATFSVVDTIALRPLPFVAPERLVAVGPGRVAPQDYVAWSGRIDAFSAMGAYRLNAVLRLDEGTASRDLSVARVSSGLFDALGVRPSLGQLFRPEHDEAGSDEVIVLSHALWSTALAADPDVVGRSIRVGDTRRTVIGVLEPGVTYPVGPAEASDAYIPMTLTPDERLDSTPSRSFNVQVVGRLRDAATIEQAQQALDAVNAGRGRARPGAPGPTHAVVPLVDDVVGPAKAWLLLALAAVACVVVTAGVNVASLLLARSTVRVRELATREMLGASRALLMMTLLVEGLLLSAAAGVAGIGLSSAGLGLITAWLPEGLARASTIALDGRVLTVAIGALAVCGLGFSAAPALVVSRTNLMASTRTGGAIIGGRRQARSLGAFLVAETAFVSLLLVATTLAVTTFVVVTTADLGYDRRHLAAFSAQLDLSGVPRADRDATSAAIRADLVRRVRAVPGVAGATLIHRGTPMSGSSTSGFVGIEGGADSSLIHLREVAPDYFDAMDLRLVAGRPLDAGDQRGAPRVVVLNDIASERLFPGSSPLGRTIRFGPGPATVVGVVRAVHMFGTEGRLEPELYVTIDQSGDHPVGFDVIVRTRGADASAVAAAREAARQAIGIGEVFEPRFFDDIFGRITATRRFNAGIMSAFGLVALVIGALGIYGTMAFLVARQVRAIGLRLALGATPARVRASVVREALGRVGAGVGIGLGGAWAVSSLFVALVFGVAPTSPLVYGGVAVLVTIVGLVAALVPAVRASRVDPLVALRAE